MQMQRTLNQIKLNVFTLKKLHFNCQLSVLCPDAFFRKVSSVLNLDGINSLWTSDEYEKKLQAF